MFLLILIPIVFFMINAIVASKFNDIAYMKGYGPEMHCFAMCFWLGIIGCLYVIALPNLNDHRGNSQISPLVNDDLSEEEKEEKEKYDKLVAQAERYKDTFFARELRIQTYEHIIKNMQIFADANYRDSAVKIQEYRSYLDGLKKGINN